MNFLLNRRNMAARKTATTSGEIHSKNTTHTKDGVEEKNCRKRDRDTERPTAPVVLVGKRGKQLRNKYADNLMIFGDPGRRESLENIPRYLTLHLTLIFERFQNAICVLVLYNTKKTRKKLHQPLIFETGDILLEQIIPLRSPHRLSSMTRTGEQPYPNLIQEEQ